MAIVKMKYVEIGSSADDYKDMLLKCSQSECFHAELASSLYRKENGEKLLQQDNKYVDGMNQMKSLIIQSGHKLKLNEEVKIYSDAEMKEHISKLNAEFSLLATEQKTKYELTTEDEVALNNLRELGFEKLHSSMFIKFIFGRLPVNSYTKLMLHNTDLFKAISLHENANYIWLCIASSATYFHEVYEILNSIYFEDLGIPTMDVNEMIGSYQDEINSLYTYCSWRNDLHRLYKYVRIVDGRYVVAGFVPAKNQELFNELFIGLDVFTTFEDPKEARKKPHPVSLNSDIFAEGLSKIDLNLITNSEFLKFTFGIVNNNGYEQLNLYDDKLFKIYDLAEKGHYHWICYVTTKNMFREVNKIFDELDFRQISLNAEDMQDIAKIYTEDTTDEERFQDLRKRFVNLDKYLKIEEGGSKEIKAPTLLKNNWFVKPFELFVDMYGIPAYSGIDPSTFVAITYFLLFGIMFGDLGQGIVLMLIGFGLGRKKPDNKLLGIIGRIGISSSIFGFLYGSVFGLETVLNPIHQNLFNVKDKLFEVMESSSTMTLIGGAIAMGVVLILISMLINMYIRFKNKETGELLFNQNGLTGFIFYSYLVAMLIGNLTGLYNISYKITNYIFIGVPIIIFLLETPLKSLVEGDGFKVKGGWGTYFAEIPFELFELLLSFVTNTMSYMRVGGFVLSHAGMMMVVMILTEMTTGVGSIVVFILGNIFVMALEGLIVGIQALRLELYEMFSRYFRAGGRKFILISEEI
jgi:V/A-type H+-transporting ATPase subunit I